MGKKGQALVEFIIILPVFLLLVLGVMDIGKIMYNKTMLEGAMSEVVSMYQKGNSSLEILDKLDIEASLDIKAEDNYTIFYLVKEIDIITPGLNLILDNPYEITVKRSISNE